MRILKKIIKVFVIVLIVAITLLYFAFVSFTAPKSDKKILESYETSRMQPKISKEQFKKFEYRKLEIHEDAALPTLVFVHGTIGSSNDFSAYMSDSLLQTKANMIAYDRIGYNYKDKYNVQESIAFERDMLKDVIKDIPKKNVILVGYSYGGPIALAVKERVRKIILLAPAVSSEAEPMPWMINFYKWKLTRWLVPEVWKQASKEKISHQKDLKKFEENWSKTANKICVIHGTADWIVPYQNSKFLETQFLKNNFKLISIPEGNHSLVWTNFEFIKKQILTELD